MYISFGSLFVIYKSCKRGDLKKLYYMSRGTQKSQTKYHSDSILFLAYISNKNVKPDKKY